nr:phosphatase PAP2 family protein [uncultured Carboxylicivirga sp.]
MRKNQLSPLWYVVLAYQLIVTMALVFGDPKYFISDTFIFPRLLIIGALIIRILITKRLSQFVKDVLDAGAVYILLGLFYTETAHLNTLFYPKIDPYLLRVDQWMFGFQPALIFSEIFNSTIFSELMFMGYFAYYLMPLLALIAIGRVRRIHFQEYAFIIFSSFFIYYIIFIFLPAEGPQFFFSGNDAIIESKGLFGMLVKHIQYAGEAPTAAFPSSHVGISLLILYILQKLRLKLFWWYLPFVMVLLFSTVYIKAHYAVDVIAGMLSMPVVFGLCKWLYQKMKVLNPGYQWKSKKLKANKI